MTDKMIGHQHPPNIPLGISRDLMSDNLSVVLLTCNNQNLEPAQKARDAALNMIQTLANTIPDLEIRDTFLEFAKGRMLAVSVD